MMENRWIRNALMVVVHGFIMLPFVMVIAGIVHAEEAVFALFAAFMGLILFSALLTMLAPIRLHVAVQSAIMLIVGYLVLGFLGIHPFARVVFTVAALVFMLMTATAVDRPLGRMFPQMKLFIGLIGYGAAHLLEFFNSVGDSSWVLDVTGTLTWPCFAYVLLCLVLLNVVMMSQMCTQRKDGTVSRNVRFGNLVMTGLLVVIAVVAVFMEPLRKFIGENLRRLFSAFFALLDGEPGEMEAVGEAGGQMAMQPEAYDPTWWAVLMEIVYEVVMNVALVAVVLAFFYLIYRVARKYFKGLARWMEQWQQDRGQYEEETERLSEEERHYSDTRERVRTKKLRVSRGPNLRGAKTAAEKLRIIYQWCAAYLTRARRYDASWTAQEMVRAMEGGDDALRFAEGYARARYSDHAVEDAAVEAGLRFSRTLSEHEK